MRGTMLCLVMMTMACGSSGAGNDDDSEATDDDSNTNGGGSNSPPNEGAPNGSFDDGKDSGAPTSDACDASSKDIVVVTRAFDMYRFHPQSKDFTFSGALSCIDPASPDFDSKKYVVRFGGIALDTKGKGWLTLQRSVNVSAIQLTQLGKSAPDGTFADQAIVTFDGSNASCTVSKFELLLTNKEASGCQRLAYPEKQQAKAAACDGIKNRYVRAMTMSSTNGTDEHLFATNSLFDKELYEVDRGSFARTTIGVVNADDNLLLPGLLGTGDGRLFGMWWKSGDSIAKFSISTIDRTQAKSAALEPMDFSAAKFAPTTGAFWGGAAWTFGTALAGNNFDTNRIQVARYDLETKGISVEIADAASAGMKTPATKGGNVIQGAASSICAPIKAPPVN